MSLKRKTTGLPAASGRGSRKYRSRTERDEQANRIVLIVAGVIAAIVVGVLAVALLIDNVINPNKVVASAAGQNVTVHNFQIHAFYQRWRDGNQLQAVPEQYRQQIFTTQQQPYKVYADMYSEMSEPVLLGKAVLDDMTDQILIAQYAQKNNITVDQSDIDKQINSFFGYQPTAQTNTPTGTPSTTSTPLLTDTPTQTPTLTPSPSQTMTPTLTPFPTGVPTNTPGPTEQYQTFKTNLQQYFDNTLKSTGLNEGDIRQIFMEQALRTKVQDKVTADVAPNNMEDQLKVRHILVDDEQTAKDIMTALQNGASFATLAKAISKDPGSGAQGGELGWKGRDTYVKPFEDAIWNPNTKVGDILGPIKSDFGYHIIQVEGHATRQITDADKQNSKNAKFAAFLADLRTNGNVQLYDYASYTPDTPTLADFQIQAGYTSQNSGIPGYPGQ